MDDGTAPRAKPPWLVPVVILVVIAGLIIVGRKKEEAVENPIVDLAVLTVGVFAVAAVARWGAVKAGAPGLAVFFGAQAVAPSN